MQFWMNCFEKIIVFNAQAGPSVEGGWRGVGGGNIKPVGLCGVPLRTTLSTPWRSSAPSASLHTVTNTHTHALSSTPKHPAHAFSRFVYVYFLSPIFPWWLNKRLQIAVFSREERRERYEAVTTAERHCGLSQSKLETVVFSATCWRVTSESK